jgi:hypothetical protein
MEKSRDSRLAAILARGLMRARQCAERAGRRKPSGDDQPQPSATNESTNDHESTGHLAADNEQGEQQ